jgi:Transposase
MSGRACEGDDAAVLAECEDKEEIIARVAALDIGKAELVCCVRLPAPRGRRRRLQEVSTHSTMTASLTELANRLVELRVQRVVMEATSDYWKPVFHLLEAHGLEPSLVNARDVKHLLGRPKTDIDGRSSGRSPRRREQEDGHTVGPLRAGHPTGQRTGRGCRSGPVDPVTGCSHRLTVSPV